LLDQKTPGDKPLGPTAEENQQPHDEVLPGTGALPVDRGLLIFRKKMVEGKILQILYNIVRKGKNVIGYAQDLNGG